MHPAALLLLATSTLSAIVIPPANLARRDDDCAYICGCDGYPNVGIQKPADNSTIIITKDEQDYNSELEFEIIYCSSDGIKSNSLHVDTWLDYFTGLAIGTTPTNAQLNENGFYAYQYNVTYGGSYMGKRQNGGPYTAGPHHLTVYEVSEDRKWQFMILSKSRRLGHALRKDDKCDPC